MSHQHLLHRNPASPLDHDEAWTVEEAGYAPELSIYYETVFTLANGVLGVRGVPEEGRRGESDIPLSYAAASMPTIALRTSGRAPASR